MSRGGSDNYIRSYVWDPRSRSDLPTALIAKVLHCSVENAQLQKHRGRLKGYDPQSVHDYLVSITRKSLVGRNPGGIQAQGIAIA